MELFDVYPLYKVTDLSVKRAHVDKFINSLKDILNT